MREREATKETKLSFERDGEVIGNKDKLEKYLEKQSDKFPLLQNRYDIIGEVGKTGLVAISKNSQIAAAVRHPHTIPRGNPSIPDKIEFGGEQTYPMVETSLEQAMGDKKAAQIARTILTGLRDINSSNPEITSMTFAGFAAIGSEPETWAINPQTGSLANISGGELQEGLIENTLPPVFDPLEFLSLRARYRLKLQEENPNLLLISTSVPPTGNPLETRINKDQLGRYISAMQQLLHERYFTGSDPLAEEVFQEILKKFGISSHNELKQQKGDMAYWTMAASHASVGLPHLRQKAYEMFVPTEIAIAVSDIFNSDLATVAELLTFSSPLIFGVGQIKVVDIEIWPRDYRAILRYLMNTTNPAPFIENPTNMKNRIQYAILNGLSHTMDRASYIALVKGQEVPVMHGRVRNRIASSEPLNQTGRVEFTGCGSTPSIIDEAARNCFLQILAVAALEAVEHQQTPMEYWGKLFPHTASWQRQKGILQKASLYGFRDYDVVSIIQESVQLIDYIANKYPALKGIAELARTRILNLLEDPVNSLEEYLQNPRGSISEVIQNEAREGKSPLEIAKAMHQFEIQQARKILEQLT